MSHRRTCPRQPTRSTRGSGIAFALIFAGVIAAVLASMLRWVMTEASLNQRSLFRLEARNAAEAIAEYGMAQVRYKMENTSTFIANSFTPSGAEAISAPPTSYFAGTHVNTSASRLIAGNISNVVGGHPTQTSTSLYYIDANDPNNINDPLKGKWVFRRDIPIYAKAVVNVQGGPPIYAYVREKISVRGAPLFAHASFYNMDMELNPGGTMNIYGPVHVNGDIYVSSTGNASVASLNFYNTVTCTGNIYHAWKNYLASTHGQYNSGAGTALNVTTPVTFKNRLGAQVSMLVSGTWKDSTLGTSTTIDTNNNSGSYTTQTAYYTALATAAATNLTAYRTYASTTWNGNVQTAANGVQNYTPVAIGRYVEDSSPSDGTDQSVNTGRLMIEPPTASSAGSTLYSAEVEAQKYSNQAGIYIQIVPASGYTNVTSGGNTTTSDPSVAATITVRAGGAAGTVAATLPTNLISYQPYKLTISGNTTSTSTVNRGLYDQRRGLGIDLVEFDITVLKEAVAQMQLPSASRNASKAISSLETTHWTGIVYLEVTNNPTTRLDGTTIVAAGGNAVAIRLINGNVQVPTYGTTTKGLTIATNAPLYIKGHFNDVGTGTLSASVPRTDETPAAIAADAITLLSNNWSDATSRRALNSPSSGVYYPTRPPSGSHTVIAAALLTGTTPTNKDGSARDSGGAHNLLRFLENWTANSNAVYVRGSQVALFESRVADEPWKIDYYSAPTRNYGFCDLFQNGTYPPGTPRVISYRRTDYSDMTKAEYDAALTALGVTP